MDKSQYQCIKAAQNEVEAYERDGYKVTMRFSTPGYLWMRFLKHPNGNSIWVEMSPMRTELRVYLNGNLKKCQKFGV